MWTELDPATGRYNVMNLSPQEAAHLCTALANAGNYAKLVRRTLDPSMVLLQQNLQASLYGHTEAQPAAVPQPEETTQVFRLLTSPTR